VRAQVQQQNEGWQELMWRQPPSAVRRAQLDLFSPPLGESNRDGWASVWVY
jgi:hypothetical protein